MTPEEQALNDFQGTPEELGQLLYEATKSPFGLTEQALQEDQQKINKARIQLRAIKGGTELLEQELARQRTPTERTDP